MNSVVIASKLESLRRCLDRITSKKPESLDQLLEDIDIQDILALNLERSIQLCVDIANHILSTTDDSPAMSMAESFERLSEKKIISKDLAGNLRRAVGFRNLSVHAYDKIDWNLFWKNIESDLKDLVQFVKIIEEKYGS
tara:strand:+ start:353 stop:769 length:417 start_codon:yes stop_codon:yes gene_type:complete